MQVSEFLKQSAEKTDVAFSHGEVDGNLICTSPEARRYLAELLQPPSPPSEQSACHAVIAAFENEPIPDDLPRLPLSPSTSFACQLTDEQNIKRFAQTFSSTQTLTLPPSPIARIYYDPISSAIRYQSIF